MKLELSVFYPFEYDILKGRLCPFGCVVFCSEYRSFSIWLSSTLLCYAHVSNAHESQRSFSPALACFRVTVQNGSSKCLLSQWSLQPELVYSNAGHTETARAAAGRWQGASLPCSEMTCTTRTPRALGDAYCATAARFSCVVTNSRLTDVALNRTFFLSQCYSHAREKGTQPGQDRHQKDQESGQQERQAEINGKIGSSAVVHMLKLM